MGLATAPAAASPIRLADLLRVDALGYDCIDEADLERAFAASGKGLHLPQTCLPKPCDVLSRQELGRYVMGRPPEIAEWDLYYARYAEYCRAETTPFDDAPPETPAEGGFWSGLVPENAIGWTVVATILPEPGRVRPGGRGTGPGNAGAGSGFGHPSYGSGFVATPADVAHWGFEEPPRTPRDTPDTPPPIPLPAAVWSLGAALAFLVGVLRPSWRLNLRRGANPGAIRNQA